MLFSDEDLTDLSLDESCRLHEAVERFEDAWQAGGPPDLGAFVPQEGDRRGVLAALVHVDLERRWKAGWPVRVEDYLGRFPELAEKRPAVLGLIRAEYELRRRGPAGVSPGEYRERFPQLWAQLAGRLGPAEGDTRSAPSSPGRVSRTLTGALPAVSGYDVLGELGRGAMGVVYQARHRQLKRLTALKMILAGSHAGEQELARFRAEAEAVARLQHPNIVQVFEVGEHGGLPFIALEYVAGGSLAQALAGAPQRAREAADMAHTLARAVAAVHRLGIVHRDLKPANVLLSFSREPAASAGVTPEQDVTSHRGVTAALAAGSRLNGCIPKIADFGLAKRLDDDSGRTRTGAVLGTPSYMAPEQAEGRIRAVGPATDVYALGAILYEMLTGRPPFRGATVAETLDQVRTQEPVPPRRLQPAVPRDLETVCLKCLHKEPRRRYATAEALAEDLGRFLAGEPVRARPVGPLGRGLRWARRRPAAAALAVVSGLALLTVVAGVVGFTQHLRNALAALTAELREEQRRHERETQAQLYPTDLRLADQFRRGAEVQQGRELLSRHWPHPGEEDRRDFAWHYLWGQCAPGRELPRAGGDWSDVAFSPDGRLLAAAGADGTIRLWDVAADRWGHELAGAHRGGVLALAFSPDGLVLAGGGSDGVIRLWDPATAVERGRLTGHQGPVTRLAFSPDGRALVSAGDKQQVKVWDVVGRREVRELSGFTSAVEAVGFSSDGRTLVTAGERDLHWGVWLWDAATGELRGPLDRSPPAGGSESAEARERRTRVHDLAFGPAGRVLATGGPAGVAQWDAADGRRLRALAGPNRSVRAIAVAADGQTLAAGGVDGSVRLWDVATGRVLLAVREHESAVTRVAFAPDGRRLASLSRQAVRVYDLAGRPGHDRPQYTLSPAGPIAVSTDGRTLAAADQDRTVKLLDIATGRVVAVLAGAGDGVNGLALAPDGRWLAAARADRSVLVWDLGPRRPHALLPGHLDEAAGVAFAADGGLLASWGKDGLVKLWDVPAGRERLTLRGHSGPVADGAFSPDGRTLATAGADQTVRFWDVAAGTERSRFEQPAGVTTLAYTADGQRLATANAGGDLDLWSADGGRRLVHFRDHSFPLVRLALGPDGQTLAAVDQAGGVALYDVASGRSVRWIGGYFVRAWSVAFAEGGRTLALCGPGGLKFWAPAANRLRQPFGRRPPAVHALAFTPDGGTLITAGRDLVVPAAHRPVLALHKGSYDQALEGSTADAVRTWNAATGRPCPSLPTAPPHPRLSVSVRALAVSGDGQTLAAGGDGGTVWVWDGVSGPCRPPLFLTERSRAYWQALALGAALAPQVPIHPEFPDHVDFVALAPDGRRLAAANEAGAVRLWDLATGQEGVSPRGPTSGLTGLAFSPDGGTLVLGRPDRADLYDAATGALLRTCRGPAVSVYSLACSPDGRTLATGGDDGRVRLWDADGSPSGELVGHTDRVAAVAFSPDGKTLASAGWDGQVKLWGLATRQELATLEAHTGKVHALAFSADGRVLASGGESPAGAGEVFFWRAGRDNGP